MAKKKNAIINVINKGSNPLPIFTKEGDACVDLRADFTNGFNDSLGTGSAWDNVSKCVRLFSGGRCVIPTGLYTSFDKQHMLKILQRSGLALKSGVLPIGGVIDSNFRSQIGVILINLGDEDFEIYQGDRIAQAALIPIERFKWNEVETLDSSERGTTGFGDSGIK